MENSANFNTEIIAALEEKNNWYDSNEMPNLLESYREFQSVLGNLISLLIKKGSIRNDPYKHDKKISDISIPETGDFSEGDRPVVLGTRLSDLESMLDFVCNYFKFSVSTLTIENIKKLVGLNNYILWSSLAPTVASPNTHALAEIATTLRMSGDSLSINVLNDCVSHLMKTTQHLNARMKEITDFQREVYKGEVRKKIVANPAFNATNASEATQQIKKMYGAAFGKKPYYTELVEEIVKEEFSSEKDQLQQALLAKISTAKKEEKKAEVKIDPKEILLDSLRTLAGAAPQLEQIGSKIEENQAILASQHNSFFEKLIHILLKMLGLPEKTIEYKINIIESVTQAKRTETVVYQNLYNDIMRRSRSYASFAVKKTPGYQKLEALTEEQIGDFLTKQISECQRLLVTLTALDGFFKTSAYEENKNRMKGLKMEISAIKTTLVKTNQRRADYTAYVEEQNQLKKLGIINA